MAKTVKDLKLKFFCGSYSSGNQAGHSVPGTVSVGSEAYNGLEQMWSGRVSYIQKIFRESLKGKF